MKNFEERYTAWLDGELNGEERVAFERELPDRDAAEKDRAEWAKLRGMMRESLAPARMPHADFVNSQVLAEIERESRAAEARQPARRGFLPIGRLAFLGAFLIVLATGLSVLVKPWAGASGPLVSEIVETHVANPTLHTYAFQAPGGRGAVLWIEEPGYIPANEKL
mgnify:FL=1